LRDAEQEQYEKVGRQNAQGASNVEAGIEVRLSIGVDEISRDEEPGEGEKQVDAGPAVGGEIEQSGGEPVVPWKQGNAISKPMKEDHYENRSSAK